MYSIIVLSGGKGKRMENTVPKQYLLLAGKPMIMHSIERIDRIAEISEIIIVCEEKFVSTLELMLQQYNIKKKVVFAHAGSTRQESVYNGLKLVSNDKTIIHEAARPFVSEEDLYKLINTKEDNVTFGSLIPYTVVKGKETISELLERSELVNVQLPQKFDTELLKKAHDSARKENRIFTEDAGMVTYYSKKPVSIISGNNINIKITEPFDLILGEVIYNEYFMGRK